MQVIIRSLPARGGGDGDQMKVTIREEIREIEEQKRRKNSVIIRGSGASNADHLQEQFNVVSQRLI